VKRGNSTYFLIVKISLNSQEFSRKTNHKGAKGAQRGMKQRFIPSFCAFVVKNSSRATQGVPGIASRKLVKERNRKKTFEMTQEAEYTK
jgi:hypothetical protein